LQVLHAQEQQILTVALCSSRIEDRVALERNVFQLDDRVAVVAMEKIARFVFGQ
jgi:hypothetical protein